MKVILSTKAERDLEDIGDFIAEASPERAAGFVAELERKALRLATYPKRFALAPGLEHLEIRRQVHGRYLIFYRVGSDRVDVLRILHGARDYPSLLGPDA